MNGLQIQIGVVHLVTGCLPVMGCKARFSVHSEHFGPRVHTQAQEGSDAGFVPRPPHRLRISQKFARAQGCCGLSWTFLHTFSKSAVSFL